MADPSYNTKKYTPPGLRNPSGVNKKIGDRAGSQQSKDGERSQPQMEKASQKIITLKDSATSEAYQLLSERWAAAMHQYNDPTVDLSERPVMYYGGSGVFGVNCLTRSWLRRTIHCLQRYRQRITELKCAEDC
ncbi:hypothetical protein Bca52824_067022 [Brassica carinata]|uniref:Uncharacterized protein n=1 Tax=Brassica carinata TaxID=52824 RepID=A0A8X7QLR4_BRACI|nr:hypothetical protein Bca52824_067022 [Brassica carinata]